MHRRRFLKNSLGLAAGALAAPSLGAGIAGATASAGTASGGRSKFSHRLPGTDQNYKRTATYIEDDPIPEYTWASDEAYEAFLDLKYGVRIHWGIYSIVGMSGASWPFLGNRQPPFDIARRQEYNQLYQTWNPTGFNADEWMSTFADSGMKMFAFTTKHHEGFSLFDTKARVKRRANWTAPGGPAIEHCDLAYSIMETPFKRDIVREVVEAGRRHGLKIDLYFSHTDFYDADFRPYGYHPFQTPGSLQLCAAQAFDEPLTEFQRALVRLKDMVVYQPDPTPEEEARMIQRHRTQLKELLTNYGPIDMMCLDIWLGPRVWPQMRQTLLELRALQPNVMFRARGIGNYGDYYTPEGFVPGAKENSDAPWFVIYPLGRGFSYDPTPGQYKGAKWIVDNLVDSAAKGGNFMVGIGPDAMGRFDPEAIAQIKEVGRWLRKNGTGIYATRPREGALWHENDDTRFTRSKDQRTVYCHCLKWPGPELRLFTVKVRPGGRIVCLGAPDTPIRWSQTDREGLRIQCPDTLQGAIPREERLAYSFAIEV
jgi:alpha-L-fucosidase